MIKNYLKVAWRNIRRNRIHSIINIAGLAIGLSSVIMILFYVQDELKYDRFFKDAHRIFQVNLDGKMGGEEGINGNTPPPAGESLVNAFPEIETYTRIFRPGDVVVRYERDNQPPNYFTESKMLAVDSNFLDVFTFNIESGDKLHCLEKTNSIVITNRTAKKYFGDQPAIGKMLLLGSQKKPAIVTAILEDIPSNSSYQFDMLVPMSSYPVVKNFSWSWVWMQVTTYVRLNAQMKTDQASIAKLEAKFPEMVKKQAASAFSIIGKPFDQFLKEGNHWDLKLQPLTKVHLYSADIASRLTTLGSIKYVYIFSAIAFFIILLACVNFINLSTAQSARRAREVGIRKVLGSVKGQLIRQFLAEAMLYSVFATVVALAFVFLAIRPFNAISGKNLYFGLVFANQNWIYVLALMIFTGLLAGSYPAFYLTSFKPVAVLKGLKIFKTNLGNLFIRNGLVVFQFTVSTSLIICTIIVFQQLRYTQNKDLGLHKDNIIVISNSDRLANSEETYRQELTKFPEIVRASICTSIPTKENFADGYIPEPTGDSSTLAKDVSISSFIIDEDFIPTLEIQLLQGRNFSKEFNDSASVILNETAVRQLGWKQPVGAWLQYPGNSQRFKVIGVARDFNTLSLHNPVAPFALFYKTSQTYNLGSSMMMVKVKSGNIGSSLAKLEKKWKSVAPNTPFDYTFLDREFEALYRSEQRMGTVFGIFTILSIFVACLGLFGLAAYTAEKRTKEIGVRKVLGASVQGLVALLSKDFLRLVVLSAVIAFPLAWWGMHQWLEDFAYRIHIGWMVFVIAAFIALFIALITVSYQAIKAALVNPVNSLRSE